MPESKSLKAYDDRQERACLAEFAQSKSLERSTSFTRRRLSRQDLNFPQAASLASVLVSAHPHQGAVHAWNGWEHLSKPFLVLL